MQFQSSKPMSHCYFSCVVVDSKRCSNVGFSAPLWFSTSPPRSTLTQRQLWPCLSVTIHWQRTALEGVCDWQSVVKAMTSFASAAKCHTKKNKHNPARKRHECLHLPAVGDKPTLHFAIIHIHQFLYVKWSHSANWHSETQYLHTLSSIHSISHSESSVKLSGPHTRLAMWVLVNKSMRVWVIGRTLIPRVLKKYCASQVDVREDSPEGIYNILSNVRINH